jgi:hypothetical protein
MDLRVTLSCGADEVTIWFAPAAGPLSDVAVKELPNAWLLVSGKRLKALRLVGLKSTCPYELAKVAIAHAGGELQAELTATFDPSCDMGYIYLDQRGPGSVEDSTTLVVVFASMLGLMAQSSGWKYPLPRGSYPSWSKRVAAVPQSHGGGSGRELAELNRRFTTDFVTCAGLRDCSWKCRIRIDFNDQIHSSKCRVKKLQTSCITQNWIANWRG